MFICRVLVGEYCIGRKDVRAPDVVDATTNRLYDTTVNNLANPEIFVTYHDAQVLTRRSFFLVGSPSSFVGRVFHCLWLVPPSISPIALTVATLTHPLTHSPTASCLCVCPQVYPEYLIKFKRTGR